MRSRLLLLGSCLVLGVGSLAWADSSWDRERERFGWQVADSRRAVAEVEAVLQRSLAAGRPVALSSLRGDLSALDTHLERLDRRLRELEEAAMAVDKIPSN